MIPAIDMKDAALIQSAAVAIPFVMNLLLQHKILLVDPIETRLQFNVETSVPQQLCRSKFVNP
jgi:hypothetical protein